MCNESITSLHHRAIQGSMPDRLLWSTNLGHLSWQYSASITTVTKAAAVPGLEGTRIQRPGGERPHTRGRSAEQYTQGPPFSRTPAIRQWRRHLKGVLLLLKTGKAALTQSLEALLCV